MEEAKPPTRSAFGDDHVLVKRIVCLVGVLAVVCALGLSGWLLATQRDGEPAQTASHGSFVSGVRIAEHQLAVSLSKADSGVEIGTWVETSAFAGFAEAVAALTVPAADRDEPTQLVRAARAVSRAYYPDCQSERFGAEAGTDCFYVNWTRAQQRSVTRTTRTFRKALASLRATPPVPYPRRARVLGKLIAVGGPPGTATSPLSGWVTITSLDGRNPQWFGIKAGADGRFTRTTGPGTYSLTGHSPQYQGGHGTCSASHPVHVHLGQTVLVNVYCQRR